MSDNDKDVMESSSEELTDEQSIEIAFDKLKLTKENTDFMDEGSDNEELQLNKKNPQLIDEATNKHFIGSDNEDLKLDKNIRRIDDPGIISNGYVKQSEKGDEPEKIELNKNCNDIITFNKFDDPDNNENESSGGLNYLNVKNLLCFDVNTIDDQATSSKTQAGSIKVHKNSKETIPASNAFVKWDKIKFSYVESNIKEQTPSTKAFQHDSDTQANSITQLTEIESNHDKCKDDCNEPGIQVISAANVLSDTNVISNTNIESEEECVLPTQSATMKTKNPSKLSVLAKGVIVNMIHKADRLSKIDQKQTGTSSENTKKLQADAADIKLKLSLILDIVQKSTYNSKANRMYQRMARARRLLNNCRFTHCELDNKNSTLHRCTTCRLNYCRFHFPAHIHGCFSSSDSETNSPVRRKKVTKNASTEKALESLVKKFKNLCLDEATAPAAAPEDPVKFNIHRRSLANKRKFKTELKLIVPEVTKKYHRSLQCDLSEGNKKLDLATSLLTKCQFLNCKQDSEKVKLFLCSKCCLKYCIYHFATMIHRCCSSSSSSGSSSPEKVITKQKVYLAKRTTEPNSDGNDSSCSGNEASMEDND